MMAVSTEQQLQERVSELESELAKRAREAAEKEQQLERYAADLRETFKEERARAQELRQSYMLTVRALASAVEARDAYTGRHAEPEIEFGFLLHDAGKVAVPDAILFKPGRLTSAERLIIEQHPITGSEIVRDIDFLGAARDVIRHHHERWDGTGYPDKLAGEAIPISARIFAVADTLDALTTNRPYRRASSIAQARVIILQAVGTHFDPTVIEAFKAMSDEQIERIKLRIG
jgi:ribonuclease P protein subunit RPR2